jgi:hypothetical protein
MQFDFEGSGSHKVPPVLVFTDHTYNFEGVKVDLPVSGIGGEMISYPDSCVLAGDRSHFFSFSLDLDGDLQVTMYAVPGEKRQQSLTKILPWKAFRNIFLPLVVACSSAARSGKPCPPLDLRPCCMSPERPF